MRKRPYWLLISCVILAGLNPVLAMERQDKIEENQMSKSQITQNMGDKKRKLHEIEHIKREDLGYQAKKLKRTSMQVFSPPIYDKTAKFILTENEGLRLYILKALSGLEITKATVLDDHLNPLDSLSRLRKLLNSTEAKAFFDSVKSKPQGHPGFIQNLANHSGDLRSAFPLPERDSQIDFYCETDEGYLTLEIQLVRQDYWDSRALAYVSSLYGNQLKKGARWHELKKVIGINLLGDGTIPYWKGKEYRRHYVVQNKFNEEIIDKMQLIQYSLGDVNLDDEELLKNKPLHDTLRFFKNASEEIDVPADIDPELKTGYELVKVDYLKHKHPEFLEQIEDLFANASEHDQIVKTMGIEEGKMETARNMIAKSIGDDVLIAELTGLTIEQVQNLRP